MIDDQYIADAQRLRIAQNKGLKLIYQTPWVVWAPRAVFLAIMVSYLFVDAARSLAIFCGIMLAVSFAGELFKRRSLAKARARVRTKGSTTTVTLHDQGIDISGALGSSHLKWAAMLQPAIYPDGVLIKMSQLNVIWLPDSALIEGSPADVRQVLETNIK